MSRSSYSARYGPPSPVIRYLTTETSATLTWLWPHRLPLAALSLLIGDPASAKSLLAADLAARLTVPQPWPDDPASERPDPATLPPLPPNPTEDDYHRSYPYIRGFPGRRIAPTAVVFAAPEDHDALPARLTAAGAALVRVSVIDGVRPPYSEEVHALRLPAHLDQLEEAIRGHDHPRLVVLDPIHELLDTGVHYNLDLQNRLLADLAAIARRCGVAILAIGHLTRTLARRMLYRIRGPMSLVAAARSILLLTTDTDSLDRRILTHLKNAYGPPAPPLAFRIVAGPRLEWETSAPADWSLSAATLDLSAEHYSALAEASDWLTDALAAGPVPARDILRQARAVGLSPRTLHRAKRLLAVRSTRAVRTDPWLWTLPAPARRLDCQQGSAEK